MSEPRTPLVNFVEPDGGMTFNPLAMLDAGYTFYTIDFTNLKPGFNPTVPLVFRRNNDSGEREVGEESRDESSALLDNSHLNPIEQQGFLDDEQARAVANLLEFHNQQNTAAVISGNNSSSPSSYLSRPTEIEPSKQKEFPNLSRPAPRDPLAPDSPDNTKRPLKTYGKRAGLDKQGLSNSAKLRDGPSTSGSKVIDSTSFILPPPVVPNNHPVPPPRRKRRFFIDTVKVIPPSEFKQQLQDTSDIVQKKVDSAPPSKKAMYYLAYGGVGKFFAHPGRSIPSVPLAKLFFSRLTMVTEQKPPFNMLLPLEPLSADLKPPESKEEAVVSDSPTCNTKRHQFHDAAAMKTPNSFDFLCKGMNNQKLLKFEYKRRGKSSKEKGEQSTSSKSVESSALQIKEEYLANQSNCQSQILEVNEASLDNSVNSDVDTSANEIVYTIHDTSMIKNEIHNQSSEICMVEDSQETAGGHSNFEMLIAAAEHHNTLQAPEEQSSENESDETVIVMKDEDVPEDLLYCTSDNMDVEGLVILGANGVRYRVTTSNQGELTLWPEENALQ